MGRATTTNPGNKRPTRLTVQTGAPQAARPAPKLPHERDESADEQRTSPDQAAVKGYADVQRGLVDTDRRQDAAPTFEVARRKKSRRP